MLDGTGIVGYSVPNVNGGYGMSRSGFYIGIHRPTLCPYFSRSFVSVNQVGDRGSGFGASSWIMDSGAFTEVTTHGRFRYTTEHYANQIKRLTRTRTLLAAVTQDYMCEGFVLAKTGMTVTDHQRLTVERYDSLVSHLSRLKCGTYLIPVLQGYDPHEYVEHLHRYDGRLPNGAWVGVGSVCKRNADPEAVYRVLDAILTVRPDLRLHGFGLKTTALGDPRVVKCLHTADSMAWSFAARYSGRDANGLQEALEFWNRVNDLIDIAGGMRP